VAIVPQNPIVLIVLFSEYFKHIAMPTSGVEFGGLDDDVITSVGTHRFLLWWCRSSLPWTAHRDKHRWGSGNTTGLQGRQRSRQRARQ
jgi:hypothetical protein